jgi:predicted GNAT family acetyltransferase
MALCQTRPYLCAMSNPESQVSELRQNAAHSRYEFDVDGATAIAVYRASPGVLTFTHTEVPASLRGQGIGSRMMRAVLADVRAQGLKVVPRCPFVADYVERNPEFADLLA